MSINRQVVQLLSAVALETVLVIAHFGYGAHIYDDPSRLHVVLPAAGALLLAGALGGLYAWRPSALTLWPLVAEVSVVFLVVFGAYHGGFHHAAKDVLYLAGMGRERLAAIFESPDFAVPDDAIFELSGVSTLVAATFVGHSLLRLVRGARRGRSACA